MQLRYISLIALFLRTMKPMVSHWQSLGQYGKTIYRRSMNYQYWATAGAEPGGGLWGRPTPLLSKNYLFLTFWSRFCEFSAKFRSTLDLRGVGIGPLLQFRPPHSKTWLRPCRECSRGANKTNRIQIPLFVTELW